MTPFTFVRKMTVAKENLFDVDCIPETQRHKSIQETQEKTYSHGQKPPLKIKETIKNPMNGLFGLNIIE